MLQILHYIELNSFALAILLLIFLNIRHPHRPYLTDQKLFLGLVITNIVLLILDSGMWIMMGRTGRAIHVMFVCSIVLYNIINPVICMIWHLYVDYFIHLSRARFKSSLRSVLPLFIPLSINIVLSILSIFVNIYYVLDENNLYYRGKYSFLLLAFCVFMMSYTMVYLIRNRKALKQKEFFCMAFFMLPPVIGGIIQFFFPDITLIWVCASLSLLVLFINLQSNQLVTDYLTGLYNRRYLDCYLEAQLNSKDTSKLVAGIMIDLNSFKMINDCYGHSSGDHALRETADLLKKTFRKAGVIARYGGDEFVVIMEISRHSELITGVEKLRQNVNKINTRKLDPYEIGLSIGYDTFPRRAGVTVASFLCHIDQLMYHEKQKIYMHTPQHPDAETS